MSAINNTASGLAAKKATVIPTTAQSQRGGVYSVNLVCAKSNRKSLTLTKKLADELQLSTDVYITVYADDGCIALSPKSIDDNSVKYSFSNEVNHIVYNANLVRFIAETFSLDYSSRTSLSFNNIKFGTVNGTAYAEVIITDKHVVASGATEDEEDEQGESDDCDA